MKEKNHLKFATRQPINEENLTVEERKQINERHELIHGALPFFGGAILALIGALADFNITVIIIGGLAFLYGRVNLSVAGQVCNKCQRKNAMEQIDKKVIGQRQTYIKEKQKIYHRSKEYIANNMDFYIQEVDVPAIETTYEITCKCKCCGYLRTEKATETIKQ